MIRNQPKHVLQPVLAHRLDLVAAVDVAGVALADSRLRGGRRGHGHGGSGDVPPLLEGGGGGRKDGEREDRVEESSGDAVEHLVSAKASW